MNLGESRGEPICQGERSGGGGGGESLLTFTLTVLPCTHRPATFVEAYPRRPLKLLTCRPCKRRAEVTVPGNNSERGTRELKRTAWFTLARDSVMRQHDLPGEKVRLRIRSLKPSFVAWTAGPFPLSCNAGIIVAQGPQGWSWDGPLLQVRQTKSRELKRLHKFAQLAGGGTCHRRIRIKNLCVKCFRKFNALAKGKPLSILFIFPLLAPVLLYGEHLL